MQVAVQKVGFRLPFGLKGGEEGEVRVAVSQRSSPKASQKKTLQLPQYPGNNGAAHATCQSFVTPVFKGRKGRNECRFPPMSRSWISLLLILGGPLSPSLSIFFLLSSLIEGNQRKRLFQIWVLRRPLSLHGLDISGYQLQGYCESITPEYYHRSARCFLFCVLFLGLGYRPVRVLSRRANKNLILMWPVERKNILAEFLIRRVFLLSYWGQIS